MLYSDLDPVALLQQCQQLSTEAQGISEAWFLLGTVGCHLCDNADALLKQLQLVADIRYHRIDIIDLPTPMLEALSQRIPVLLTQTSTPTSISTSAPVLLCYPFSVLDLQRLLPRSP